MVVMSTPRSAAALSRPALTRRRGGSTHESVPEGPVDRDEDLPRTRAVSVLAQPDALPGAQVQLAVGHRDGQVGAEEAGLHVGGLKKQECSVKKIYIIDNISKIVYFFLVSFFSPA